MTDMRNNKSQMAETETNNTKTLKEIFSEEIRAELASGRTKKPTFEEFKEMVEKEKAKRRKKYTAIAACFVAALVVGFFAFDMMADDVGADKNPKEIIQTEDGVIIEDGGYGSSSYKDNLWFTEDWADVEDAKEITPKLLIPNYIPKGYMFKTLTVETIVGNDVTCEFLFKNNKGETLEIEQHITSNNLMSIEIEAFDKSVLSSNGVIYIKENDNQIATIQRNDGIVVNIWANISDEEILEIEEGLK